VFSVSVGKKPASKKQTKKKKKKKKETRKPWLQFDIVRMRSNLVTAI